MTIPQFTYLSKLEIRECPQLSCIPLFPKLDEELRLQNARLEPLQQTIKMMIGAVPSSSSSSSTLGQHLFKLKVLWIVSFKDLETLPKELLQNLTSLQELHLINCKSLASLPLKMHQLNSLRELEIRGCAQLKERRVNFTLEVNHPNSSDSPPNLFHLTSQPRTCVD
ncbi:hypothetical protein GH714_002410 [Hevea brasiliensis]|uniref:NB-ARC domain-containing protein n=1 Tax=Hevea brasiliensis TaxID=3981 RepID=A0A6A6KWX6_HEVBR|nr:hypothetical protein GH714_002410 [Hevea brasiliensis]